MPVRWTPDKDQLLLLKILQTHQISVDAKRISEAWPKDQGEVPSPRAITERLVKIRKDSKDQGVHFGISSSQSKVASGKIGKPKTGAVASRDASTVNSRSNSQQSTHANKRKHNSVKQEPVSIEIDDSDDESVATINNFSQPLPSRYAEPRNTEFHYTEPRYAEPRHGPNGNSNPNLGLNMSRGSVHQIESDDDSDEGGSPTKRARQTAHKKPLCKSVADGEEIGYESFELDACDGNGTRNMTQNYNDDSDDYTI